MTEPQTLLAMAGAPQQPAQLADAAIVVIDAQGEYRTGRLRLDAIDPALANIAKLLNASRAVSAPIFHVAHKGKAGGLFDRAGDGGAILPEAAPADAEPVVEKGLPNAFAGTDLAERLTASGRKELILAGFMTHMCVSSTARAALDLGYRVTTLADATATRSLPDPTGGAPLSAEQLHRAALAALADRFSIVARTRDIT